MTRAAVVRALLAWGPVIACAAVVFYVGSSPALPLTRPDTARWLLRKAIHVVEYAAFGSLVFVAPGRWRSVWGRAALGLGSSLLLGGLDEWRQTWTPFRDGTVRDVGIDLMGAGLGQLWGLGWIRLVKCHR